MIFFGVSFLHFFIYLQKGYRSLHTAARKDFAKAAKLLLQKDHKPDIEAPVSLSTFLIFFKTTFFKVSIHTIYNDAMQNIKSYFFFQNGFTPLHIAAKYGNQNVAGVLIQHGATIDYKTKV